MVGTRSWRAGVVPQKRTPGRLAAELQSCDLTCSPVIVPVLPLTSLPPVTPPLAAPTPWSPRHLARSHWTP